MGNSAPVAAGAVCVATRVTAGVGTGLCPSPWFPPLRIHEYSLAPVSTPCLRREMEELRYMNVSY